MFLSIIIPVFNEALVIEELLLYLRRHAPESLAEIIVVDGGSHDFTVAVATQAGATTVVVSPGKGRAAQMNYGASLAKGDVLYFIHADCFPAKNFIADIGQALVDGYDLGRYRTSFDSGRTILKINALLTRFDFFICMGGDQTLFITKKLFDELGGFNESMKIMEEFEFCRRARMKGRYKIMNGAAIISARKYETNSWLTVQLANAKIVRMYKAGASQQEMLDEYSRRLQYRKNAF
ncbi:MAG: TIGR04283 family arsenosugar biosynthesis glycosyltransferase [Bacteroidota bacterium]